MNKQAIQEVQELSLQLKALITKASKLAANSGEDAEVSNLWDIVRGLLAAAVVEHWRLLGMDVARCEDDLRAKGWGPWSDLFVSDADSSTAVETPPDGSPTAPPEQLAPSLQLMIDPSGHLVLAIPLSTRVLPIALEGGE